MNIKCVVADCHTEMVAIHRWHKVIGGMVKFWSCPNCPTEIIIETEIIVEGDEEE